MMIRLSAYVCILKAMFRARVTFDESSCEYEFTLTSQVICLLNAHPYAGRIYFNSHYGSMTLLRLFFSYMVGKSLQSWKAISIRGFEHSIKKAMA